MSGYSNHINTFGIHVFRVMMDGAPADSVAACHPPGLYDHFVKRVKLTPEGSVLLFLDGILHTCTRKQIHTHPYPHPQEMYNLLRRREKIIL
jgi:hypothetical protein